MAEICGHGRQYAHCGDCWNKGCDECGATLDALDVCEAHGKRENPRPPLAEGPKEFMACAYLIITIEKLVTTGSVQEAMQDVQNDMLKYYAPHRDKMPGHSSRIEIHAELYEKGKE